MNEHTICPWCQTEIVWDEEIGPEKHCPYCENELSGYRTVQIGIDGIDDGEEEAGNDDWRTGEAESAGDEDYSDYRQINRSQLLFEGILERMIDEQEEAPECPICRELMMEAGMQTVPESQFAPRTPALLGATLVPSPLQVVWYACPSCFHMESKLARPGQERLVELLTKAAEQNG